MSIEHTVLSLESKGVGAMANDGFLYAATVAVNNPAILIDERVIEASLVVGTYILLKEAVIPQVKEFLKFMYYNATNS